MPARDFPGVTQGDLLSAVTHNAQLPRSTTAQHQSGPMRPQCPDQFARIGRKFRAFRVDNGKANLAPPAESSTWREIVSVSLGNARGAIAGDSVGVVIPWTWPDRSGALKSAMRSTELLSNHDIRSVSSPDLGFIS
jgi:hypothetical protein